MKVNNVAKIARDPLENISNITHLTPILNITDDVASKTDLIGIF